MEEELNPRLFTLVVKGANSLEPIQRRYSDFLLFFNLLHCLNEEAGKNAILLPCLPQKNVKFYVNLLLDQELVNERKYGLEMFARMSLNSKALRNRFDVYCFFYLKNEGFAHFAKLVKSFLTTRKEGKKQRNEIVSSPLIVNDLFSKLSVGKANKTIAIDKYLLDLSLLGKTRKTLIEFKKTVEQKIKASHQLLHVLVLMYEEEGAGEEGMGEYLKYDVIRLTEVCRNISNQLLPLFDVEINRVTQIKNSLESTKSNNNAYNVEFESMEKTRMFCYCVGKFIHNQVNACKEYNSLSIGNLIKMMSR